MPKHLLARTITRLHNVDRRMTRFALVIELSGMALALSHTDWLDRRQSKSDFTRGNSDVWQRSRSIALISTVVNQVLQASLLNACLNDGRKAMMNAKQ